MDYAWTNLVNYVRTSLPAHQNYFVPKQGYLHPLQAGFLIGPGESRDPVPHYRMAWPDGSGIHVMEYSDGYLAHWDYRDPGLDPVGHIQYDAPQYLPVLNAAVCFGIAGLIIAGLSLLDPQRS